MSKDRQVPRDRAAPGHHAPATASPGAPPACRGPSQGAASVDRVTVVDDAPDAQGTAGHLVAVPLRRSWLLVPLVAGLALSVVSAMWLLAKGRGWQPGSLQLDRVLNVDEDLSVLNWLTASAFLLAGCAALLASRTGGRGWLVVAAVALFVSVDEAVGLHDPLQAAVERWVADGGVGLAVVAVAALGAGVVVLRFLLAADRAVGLRLLGVLALVAVAAVGIDAIGPDLAADPARRLEAWYVAKATSEEALELVAAVLALDACLLAAARAGSRRPGTRTGPGPDGARDGARP